MMDIDDEEGLLLARARRVLSPTAADTARVRTAALLAVGTALRDGGADDRVERLRECSDSRASTMDVVGTGRKLLSGLALVAAAGVGYAVGFDAGRGAAVGRAPPLPSPSALAIVQLNPVPDVPGDVPAPPQGSHGTATSTARSTAAEPRSRAGLEQELRALKQVDRALREQRPREALELLDALDRDVPGGHLGEEREAARTLAECDLRPAAAARLLADDFSKLHPTSVYGPRVQRSCGAAEPDER